jgi:hypothetical protein
MEFRERLLSFGAESFVFQFATKKYKNYNAQNYNFAFSFVWIWSLVFHTERGPQAESVREYRAETDIRAQEG